MSLSPFWIDTDDWHTAGEPFRIVEKLPDGYLPESSTVAQRRLDIIATPEHPLDQLRQSLCHEPRGHADMYGGFITPPDDVGAAFGVLFWHKDGFSTACGHGTIALGYWAVANGLVEVPENGTADVVIDGKPVHADFINVASYQIASSLPASIPSRGVEVSVELAFSGVVYAALDAGQLGLKVEPGNVDEFIKLGREIKASLGKRAPYGIYDCYGVIFFNEEGDEKANGHGLTVRQSNVTVFADGQIDRSPCGSGTCARLVALYAQGRLGPGQAKLQHRSIIVSSFEADIVSDAISLVKGFPAYIPRVRGDAKLCGKMSFYIDPTEDIYPGFLLR
ncbi:hypothetical protein EDB81DRAFT_847150 [Dactylonectria macrodidyma]|uniref:trans-L-3-hydroxyproline dehydratase n=1 Tax=Dactylonectria macrodidyma TaxID=307937 RepID=A0A9P9DR97_9HYPO|nr:hypothetical protein EDB81DRAFT_847150 [Dactylonectria macrodidyma]